jgi:hypothetical protein
MGLAIRSGNDVLPPLRYEEAAKMEDEQLRWLFSEHVFEHREMFANTTTPPLVAKGVDESQLSRREMLAIIETNQDWFDPKPCAVDTLRGKI